MAKVKNLINRTQVFNLEHPTFVNAPGANGVGKPESITFLPKETKEVHPDALACVEIKAAIKPKDETRKPTLRVVG